MAREAGLRSRRATFAVLVAGLCSYSLLQSMVIPVLPALQEELGTTQADITWVLTANLLAASVATPIAGRLGDMFGKRRMFVAVLTALSLGCLLSALAGALPLMIVGRVLQGIGGGVIPLGYSIVRDEFPDASVPSAIGALSSLIAVGSGAGLVIAGPIDETLGLPWLFWLPMVVGAVAALFAFLVVPESQVRTPGRVNLPAALLLSGWLVCVLLAVSRGTVWGWGSPRVLGLLAGAAVLLVAWIAVETRSAVPLIDMRMMRLRAVWTANLVAFLVGLTVFAAFAFIPQFLQTSPEAGYGFGASIGEVGLAMLPQTLAGFAAGLCSGGLVRRFGARNVVTVGTLLAAIAYGLVTVAHDQYWHLQVAFVIMGAGMGTTQASMATVVVSAVPRTQTGAMSGMNANIRTIGGAIGSAVMATVVTASAPVPGGLPTESGYVTGFGMLTVGMLACAAATRAIPGTGRRRRAPVGSGEVAATPLAPLPNDP
ncbi:MFS transporter [Trujillonella endophytica]|uniref:Drug resistance transporter, EmrB/QacA subfamily n=1 Tax=Trujillonella endophytica TaxID=673521 RepID=A0A1H8WDT8_9ACTN|nr:MFS transporter [Trujillella endophytica]SEP25683.1 drug resistance transporter, EmrB/QacA subfamily [Trujillella endophytica]